MDVIFAAYDEALRDQARPAAFVDLDVFEQNLRDILQRSQGMPVRLASKSIRCPDLIRRALETSDQLQGLMCFHGLEACQLAQQGFDDLLVAYPSTDVFTLKAVCDQLAQGSVITLMVDNAEQAARISTVAQEAGVVVPLCMDVDMSLHLPGLNFGVYRSPIRDVNTALALYRAIAQLPNVELQGVMGYEAQVAGLPDNVPGQRAKNLIVRQLKKRSVGVYQQRRQDVVAALEKAGASLRFVNGGGTGSLESTASDPSVTEVTAGSGLYAPALFDHYQHFKHGAALMFALEVCRKPETDIATCLGGGYIASGSAGKDKLPLPVWPQGLSLLDNEGAGEVQTPVRGDATLEIGDTVYFRHAKAGELTERFNKLLLVRGRECVGEALTYRGLGWQFI